MNTFNKYILATCVLSMATVSANALTLEGMITHVMQTNPSILSAVQNVEQATETKKQSAANFLPTVSANLGISRTDRDNTGTGNTDAEPRSASITLSQTLFAGGQNIYGYRSSKAGETAARASFIEASQGVIKNAIDAYIGVLTSQDVLELQNNQVQVLEKQLRLTKVRFKEGEVTKTDIQQAQARLSSAIAAKVEAHADFITSKESFKNLYGSLPKQLEWPNVNFDVPLDLSSLREEVLATHPAIQAAVSNLNSASNKLKAAYGAHAPTLTATASYTDSRDGFADDYKDKSIGLNLNVPLFEGGRTQSSVREARSIKEQSLQSYEVIRRNIEQELVASIEYYKAHLSALSSYEVAEKASLSARAGVVKEQETGERTTLDVLDAEQELLQAMVSVAQAKGRVITSAYRILAATGALTDHFRYVENEQANMENPEQ